MLHTNFFGARNLQQIWAVGLLTACLMFDFCGQSFAAESAGPAGGPAFEPKAEASTYCFFEATNQRDWQEVSVSDASYSMIKEINRMYERGDLLLPVLSLNGVVWFATGCDDKTITSVVENNQFTVRRIPYQKYREELERASQPYQLLDLSGERK